MKVILREISNPVNIVAIRNINIRFFFFRLLSYIAELIKHPPPLVAALHYSAKVRTEAVVRLGFYRALSNVKTLFRKSSEHKGKQAFKALQDAAQRMKRDTEKSVVFNLKDYRENLKFRFLFKLVDATSAGFGQAVLDRFQAYFSDLSATIEGIGKSQKDKEKAIKIIEDMDQACQVLSTRVNQIRKEIELSSHPKPIDS